MKFKYSKKCRKALEKESFLEKENTVITNISVITAKKWKKIIKINLFKDKHIT